jgi:hypothetical protein
MVLWLARDYHEFATLHYLDTDMLMQFSAGLKGGVSFEDEVQQVVAQWKGASAHARIGFDQPFPVAVGGRRSRKSKQQTKISEKRVKSLKALFSQLFNEPKFKARIIPVDANKSLESAFKLDRMDNIPENKIGQLIQLSGQIVRATDDGSTEGDVVDLLVGPDSDYYQLRCQAVAIANISEMDPRLDALLPGGPWFRVLGTLHGGPGRGIRVGLRRRGNPVGLADRLSSADVHIDEDHLNDVYAKMQLDLFAIFT